MMCFSCKFSVRKGKKTRKVSITNIINITAWNRRRREEINRFECDATFRYGLRAFLWPNLSLRLLDSFRYVLKDKSKIWVGFRQLERNGSDPTTNIADGGTVTKFLPWKFYSHDSRIRNRERLDILAVNNCFGIAPSHYAKSKSCPELSSSRNILRSVSL